MNLRLRLVQIATGGDTAEGVLVFSDLTLVAVLTRLSDFHDNNAGRWFLEAGFGRLDHPRSRIFADLDEAQAWIAQQLTPTNPRF